MANIGVPSLETPYTPSLTFPLRGEEMGRGDLPPNITVLDVSC
ncbi:MAG: hypothetical protein ACK4Z6_03030 [Candidatus Methylomirabilales bacterium]